MAEKKDKKRDRFVDDWTARIKAGMEYRQRYSSHKQWPEYRKMYRGQWDNAIVPVNRIFSYGRSLIPRVYFRSPRVSVTATHPELVWHAKVVEAVDNMLIRETLLKWTLKKSSLDAYLCGTGPIKIGYDSEFGYIPEQAVTEDGETITQVGQKEGERIEYSQGVKPGMPWALSIKPEDIVVPWGAGDMYSLPWYAHYILRPLDDIKEDQKYKHTEKLKGTRTPNKGGDKPQYRPREKREKDVLLGELWEIHDWKSKQMITLCENEVLLSEEDPVQIEGLPIEFVQFNPDPEFFWAIPDCSIIEPQQTELNEVRTQASRHRKIALLKFLYKIGLMKEEELEKFFSGAVGPGVAVDGDEPIASVVALIQPHIPPELWQEARMILEDMREELGFASNQLSSYKPGTPPTAKEAGIVEQSFDVRVDERKDIIADVLVSIVRKWNQVIFERWTEEKVIQIVSPQGTPFWIQYTGDQIRGEYLLSVDPESGMPLNRAIKYAMAKDLFMMLNGDRRVDQQLLLKILTQHYESVEPLAARLAVSPAGISPMREGTRRQPGPMGAIGAGGKGRGSTPQTALAFEEGRKQIG